MINLGGGYLVCPTSYGYNLVLDRGQKNKETGKPVYYPVSYHGNLESAVAAAMRIAQREELSKQDYSLKEAVAVMERIQKEFIETLHEVIGRKETIEDED
ncbi:MAG: hypothetical protein E7576_07690 [Ruminococcaceae bacterium]|nr:hypothetical protein [Oscillospiraceae bacterium]